MQFSLSSVLVAFAVVSSVVATPTGGDEASSAPQKRAQNGVCNGTSCKLQFVNYACTRGTCVGDGAGDGAWCTVEEGGAANCPHCGDASLCANP
ncbi:uncharacterized protein F4822DRAFT_426399 [Hypoxylon trugodes]|uniref:uncharacterized protein n=1 Tax=Hypoxylon trugodes TaxID=326681 RepID=UPI0021965778|nr:uncharacterized protein F4822DRAFT_426399 [Hypoxylon trugodes]KAI1390552.1 hypothetical protein F4822DRAFT_426399 [Hypoxylon trugodes]